MGARVGRLWWVLATGCGPLVASEGDTGTSTGAPDPATSSPATTDFTTSPGTTATTSPGTSVGTTVGEESSDATDDDPCPSGCCDFIGCADFGGETLECDVWLQDCPFGQKCMPWANDGGAHWNATRCSPLAPVGGSAGDPCLVEGSGVSGIDDCGHNLQCMFVDAETDAGTCVANCGGAPDDPLCIDPITACTIEFGGVIHACLPSCNPLLQDCVDGASCVPTSNDAFVCAPTLFPDLSHGDVCNSAWDCLPGFACLPADLDPDCEGESCCLAFCDLTLGDAYCSGQTCTPWYAQPPFGAEDIGICTG